MYANTHNIYTYIDIYANAHIVYVCLCYTNILQTHIRFSYMQLYIYMHDEAYMYIEILAMHMPTYIHFCIHAYIYIHVCLHTSAQMCILYMYLICIYVYMYTYI